MTGIGSDWVAPVIDASVVLAWALPGKRDQAVASDIVASAGATGFVVPSLWRLELANTLVVQARRGRIGPNDIAAYLQHFDRLAVVVDTQTDARAWVQTWRLAQHHALTVYDAAYLELAVRLQTRLATLDRRLAAAARMAGVAVLP